MVDKTVQSRLYAAAPEPIMKLMHRHLRIVAIMVLGLALSACPAPRRPPPAEAPPSIPAETPTFPGASAHRVVAEESLVRILVFRGGKLASAGHNHVISSRQLDGTVWWHQEPARSGFQITVPVAQLEVDDQQIRSQEGEEFAREVPLQARQGTRENMLGPDLLDVGHHPSITLTSGEVSGSAGSFQVRTRVDIKGQAHEVTIPVSVQREGERLVATGEFPLKQSELGLTPFSVMMGALVVQDEMRVKFRIVAQRQTPSPMARGLRKASSSATTRGSAADAAAARSRRQSSTTAAISSAPW
jgi:polyisoprenoid-binding protein YceI